MALLPSKRTSDYMRSSYCENFCLSKCLWGIYPLIFNSESLLNTHTAETSLAFSRLP